MMNDAQKSQTLYASANFLVESYPAQNATELIRLSKNGRTRTVSNVIFKGEDAALFLEGFTQAFAALSSDEQVESEYLGKYEKLMEVQCLQ